MPREKTSSFTIQTGDLFERQIRQSDVSINEENQSLYSLHNHMRRQISELSFYK